MDEDRTYREKMLARGLVSFRVVVKETDLHVSASRNLEEEAKELVEKYRHDLEAFIVKQPVFQETFKPFDVPATAPDIVRSMAEAAKKSGVGPMAAVAGAIAEFVGKGLLKYSDQVIVENGGDIFICTSKPRIVAVYAGASPLSNKVGLEMLPAQTPLGVCTSAGTIGHSFSFGKADAVVVVSKDTALADAAATAIGNKVHYPKDIQSALDYGKSIDGIQGIVIIKDDRIGAWGDIKISSL